MLYSFFVTLWVRITVTVRFRVRIRVRVRLVLGLMLALRLVVHDKTPVGPIFITSYTMPRELAVSVSRVLRMESRDANCRRLRTSANDGWLCAGMHSTDRGLAPRSALSRLSSYRRH